MSKAEYDVIIQAIEQTCEAHQQGIRGILASIDANATITNSELKAIKDHLGELNGSVARLKEDNIKGRDIAKDYLAHKAKHDKRWEWAKKNWWLLTLFGLTFLTLVIAIYDTFGIRKLIAMVFDKL